MTAGHILTDLQLINQHQKELADFEHQKATILNDQSLTGKHKNKQIGRLQRNPDWIRNQAILWGGLPTQLTNGRIDPLSDIGVGKLEPFDPTWVQGYPIFKDPTQPMPIGTSLCRLGYPLHQINATFDEQTGQFSFSSGSASCSTFS